MASAAVRFCTKATQPDSESINRIQRAMISHPCILAWPAHYSIPLLEVMKGKMFVTRGSHSICMAAHLPSRTGIAFKIRDGAEQLDLTCILIPILRRLDLLTEAEWQGLAPLAEQDIRSFNGSKIGSIKASFSQVNSPTSDTRH
ncbi:asparaginase [Bradyrhizobium erythrophlei]|uniref:asparaginase n=1 Tax=Bradyrhizobium erythrophlei TaxID=1437360 RepID=UPI0035EA6997